MEPFLTGMFGNPASHHVFGRAAAAAVEDARDQLAVLIGGHSRDVVFTSGATESNNLALIGGAGGRCGHVVSVATEHKSFLIPFAASPPRAWP